MSQKEKEKRKTWNRFVSYLSLSLLKYCTTIDVDLMDMRVASSMISNDAKADSLE